MFTVKATEDDNSIFFEMPQSVGIKAGVEYYLIPQRNSNGYYLIPKIKNPYKDAVPGSMYSPEI
ncbi:transcription elongation factor GreAB [Companilactobacillus mishanensis]|uniref:transcription elongation factor GreAB n=1 Tax=Companilactobacillus mishanensis TaxID=2486008 RepID=UPI0012952499|nr:transcription elongation factor GreAB [Companilactobacillus mishanensis]MQS89699.1 transcription elongation factor GreAB [Companilactobacillus mishanensis]